MIDAEPRTLREWWNQLSILQVVMLALFFGGVLPWLILFGGVLMLGLWDTLTR